VNPLIAKIEENAAHRLVLPPLSRPADELPRYKKFLKVEFHRLRMSHRGGASGLLICQARAAMMDALVRHLWEAIIQLPTEACPRPNAKLLPKVSLIAFGGYGRAELSPFSDIDLMFLHASGLDIKKVRQKVLKEWISSLLYTLWDVGLKVGHAVRTIDECVKVANQDMQSKTSLLEARLLCGDVPLFERFQARFEARCVRGKDAEYVGLRLADQKTRRAKHGNSPAMQEPNVKNGVGGLRDYQNLLWMAYFKHRTRSLMELQTRDFLSSGERKQLEAAHDYLLRVRNELHYCEDRPVEVLSAALKPKIALGLGYSDRSPRVRVEKFMRDYYTHARNIYLISRTLEQRLALVPAQTQPSWKRLPSPNGLAPILQFDGFRVVNNQLLLVFRNGLRDDPRRFLRAFRHCQQRGLTLHPDLAQIMRQQVALVNRGFISDRHNHSTFLEILNQRSNVAPHLRAMHEVGFLGKFLPEFNRLTNLVQHEFYHQYAVDEHTLTCIEKLDRVWDDPERPYANYTPLLHRLERPFVLYLALLLHDSGKAFNTGHHEVLGGELALKVARRLKLDGGATHALQLVIEQHLAMVQISQRRDLEDSGVIQQFAELVGTPEHLDMLTLHTFADSMGTSDTLWNGFKDTLLWTLHHKTAQLFQGGREFHQAQTRRRELLRDEVRTLLPKAIAKDEIAAHFDGLPIRYFNLHTARDVALDLSLIHRFLHYQLSKENRALEPVIAWQEDRDRGYTAVHVCTWDRSGLFSKIAGALTVAGLNIYGAQIFTRADGIALDTFYVAEARTGAIPSKEARQRTEVTLQESLAEKLDLDKAISQSPRYQPIWQANGERIPTRIRFDQSASPQWTIIDLEAEDRVGLLYSISRALLRLGLNIALARIITEKGAAMDTMYVSEADGSKIQNDQRLAEVERRLRQAIDGSSSARANAG